MSGSNVVPITGDAPPAPAIPMPAHFKRKGLKAAWDDLVGAAKPEQLVTENRFTFEMAATLLAKFRAGDSMTATESKDLKRYMIALGLAKADDGNGPEKPNKLSKYIRR